MLSPGPSVRTRDRAGPLAVADRAPPRVLVCDLDDMAGLPLEAALSVVTAEEIARADRFVQGLHRARFLRGRAFLRRRLAEALDCPPTAVPILTEANGKPCLGRPGPAFNLSHSGPLAVLALRDRGDLGIDVELAGPEGSLGSDMALLAEGVLTPAERAGLDTITGKAQRRRFLEFWTAKEARMKLTGEGLALDPQHIELRLDDAGRPSGYARPDWPAAELTLIDLGPLTRYDAVCTLCLAAA